MKMPDFYTAHKVKEGHWIVSKLGDPSEIPDYYEIRKVGPRTTTCSCPTRIQPCKHIALLKTFEKENHLGDGWLYDGSKWFEPIVL